MAATKPVLVTTEKQGVFMGWVEPDIDIEATLAKSIIRLERAQMCVRWPNETHGVMGLTNAGPSDNARIGPPSPELWLVGLTGISSMTSEAAKRWVAEPWG